jgi:hypothetical protein
VGGVRKGCRVPLEWVCGNILGGDGRWEKLCNFLRFEVGNGSHVSFWHNWW